MPDLLPVTLDDMIEEVARELRLRARFYAERVRTGRMNRRRADRQFDVMEAVLKHLEEERANGRAAVAEQPTP